MKYHLDYSAKHNMSEEEKQNYRSLYADFFKKKAALNKMRKDIEASKRNLHFWCEEQRCAKKTASKNYPISAKTLAERKEYFSPANDIWDTDHLPTRATLSYAMSLFYKELIKYGEKFHKRLKSDYKKMNNELNELGRKFKSLEKSLNNKYESMLFPVKVTLDRNFADSNSIQIGDDGTTAGWIDVNPHNEHSVQLDSIIGLRFLTDINSCLKVEAYPKEKLLETAATEEYRNQLEMYSALFKTMPKD